MGESASGKTSGTSKKAMRRGPILIIAAIFLAVSIRLFKIVDQYSVDIFFGDHWTFEDSTLFQKHSWLEIFRWQHGPHRQGLGGLLLAMGEPLIHWNQRYVTFGLALVIACACLAALWLKYRIFGEFGYSDVTIPLLFFTPVQYETLFGANNPSHGPLPVLLVVLYCLAWTMANSHLKYGTILLVNILLIYTGFGLFMGLITPALFGLEYFHNRERNALIALAIAIVSMGSFFVGYRNDPAVDCFSMYPNESSGYLSFLVFMFSSFVHLQPTRLDFMAALIMGSILLSISVATSVHVLWRFLKEGTSSLRRLAPSVLLGYSLIFCCAASYGRTCENVVPAPRYMIYLVPAFLGLYFAALSARVPILRREYIGVLLLISLLSSGWVGSKELRAMSSIAQQRRSWKDCYIVTRDIGKCDVVSGAFIYASPEPADLQPKLDFLENHHLSLFR